MKKITFFLLALLCHFMSYAQSDPSIEEQVLTMMSDIDVSEIQQRTGIFYDQVPEYMDLTLFDGKNLVDSLRTEEGHLLLAHDMLAYAFLDSSNPLRQDSVWEVVETLKQSGVVSIGHIVYQYDRFSDDIVEDSLIYYDGSKFQHHPNAVGSPFDQDTVVLSSMIYDVIIGDTVTFVFPKELYMTNMALPVSIEVDFGDGNGSRLISLDQSIDIIYSSIDTFDIDIKTTLGTGEVFLTGSKVVISEVPVPSYNRGLAHQLRMGNEYNTAPDIMQELNGTTVHGWLNQSCMNTGIRKPLIIIEGFDPADTRGFDQLFDNQNEGLLEANYFLVDEDNNPKNLDEFFHDESYDIFYIDLVDGAARIQDNAAFVKEAIEWINEQKAMNGSSEQNIIIGASMGGLLGKWALREFEMNGEDHETEIFITFDSPLQGANIPLAFQALPIRLGNEKVLGKKLMNFSFKKVKELKSGYEQLTSTAAKQMLYYHLALNDNDLVDINDLTKWHDEFYKEFNERGDLDIPHMAISNGSIIGEEQEFGQGELLFFKLDDLNPFGIISNFNLSYIGYSLPGIDFSGHNDQFIFNHQLQYTILGVGIASKGSDLFLSGETINYDSAPGGMTTFAEVDDNGVVIDDSGYRYKSFCFIPTISALDIRSTTDPYAVIDGNVGSHIRTYEGSQEKSEQYGIQQHNQVHVSFNTRLASFVLNIALEDDLGNSGILENRTYNYGISDLNNITTGTTVLRTTNVINHDLVIRNNGVLAINRDGDVGYSDNANINADNDINTDFIVKLSKTFCDEDPIVVDVENTGLIRIGDESIANTGSLVITKDNKINMKAGSNMIIEPHSSLVIESGATLELHEGSTVNVKNGVGIIVEKGGNLIVHKGATLMLEEGIINQYSYIGSSIELHGNVILPSGELKISGKGSFIFDEDHQIVSDNHGLYLKGHGTDYTSFVIKSEVFIDSKRVFINDSKWMLHRNLTLQNCYVKIEDFKANQPFDGRGYINGIDSRDFVMLNAEMNSIAVVVEFNGSSRTFYGDGITSTNSSAYAANNFYLAGAKSAIFNNATITSNSSGFSNLTKTGIYSENNQMLSLNFSTISGFRSSGSGFVPGTPGTHAGVRLRNTTFLTTKYCTLDDNKYGVYGEDDFNIVMTGTTISNSNSGIKNTVDHEGFVKMICSSLIDNNEGILGYDITLAIDGLINGQATNGAMVKNYFKSNFQHFNIAYINKMLPEGNELLARYNNWVNPNSYNLYSENEVATLDQSPENGQCQLFVVPDCDDPVSSLVIEHPSVDPSIYNGLNPLIAKCDNDSIIYYYRKGYVCLFNEEYDEAIRNFNLLSKKYYNGGYTKELSQLASEGRYIIDIADQFSSQNFSGTAYNTMKIINECVGYNDTLHFDILLDVSSSVTSTEYTQMLKGVTKFLEQASLAGSITYSVFQFAGTGQFQNGILRSNDLTLIPLLVRPFSGSTDVSYAISQYGRYITSGSEMMIFTDAIATDFGDNNFSEYYNIRSSGDTRISIFRYQYGNSTYDVPANKVSARISSTGGFYTGSLTYDPSDPEGDAKPRSLYPVSYNEDLSIYYNTVMTCNRLVIRDNAFTSSGTITWIAKEGGQIIVEYDDGILTNGVGRYIAVLTINGCKYFNEYEFNTPAYSQRESNYPERLVHIDGKTYLPHEVEARSEVVLTDEHVGDRKITVYPNPSKGQLFLTGLENIAYEYQVYDATGRNLTSLISKTGEGFNVEKLRSGVYTLKLTIDGSKKETIRFLRIE